MTAWKFQIPNTFLLNITTWHFHRARRFFFWLMMISHDLSDITDGALSFNVINCEIEKNSIIRALKTGKSYGVNFKLQPFINKYEKETALQSLPVIEEVDVKNDTLLVRMNKNVDSIKYIGQNGILKKTSINCNKGSYKFRKDDTYIRIEIVCKDGSVYYLNPVFRYDGSYSSVRYPVVDVLKTRIYMILFFSILLLTIFSLRKYSKYLPYWRM